MSTKYPNRNPGGVVKNRPIALRLMPDELSDAERIAQSARVSRSKLARLAYVRGLPLVVSDLSQQSATPPADLSAGEENASSPALSLTAA